LLKTLLRTKNLDRIKADAESADHVQLKRSLGPVDLMSLGIGATIGTGIFAVIGTAAAGGANHSGAGPAVALSFVLTAVACAFCALCYAEFAALVPISGSAYTYSYATMGELVAWIIGWDLVLEYALGAATVSIAWSEYLNKLLGYFNAAIPYQWSHSPFEVSTTGLHGVMNIPALFIVFLLSILLIRGARESALVNAIIVVAKVSIVILFIIFGWSFINPANHTPFVPAPTNFIDAQGVSHHFGGIMGILGAAGVVFFAFIGFDAVSTAAQETKDPKKDLPIGILGSLVICTVLYILFSYVLTGVATINDFRTVGKEASVAFAIQTYMTGYGWLAKLVTVAILAGFSSVILVMLYGQSRVFYTMSRDRLVPGIFSDLHNKFRTPYKSNLLFFLFVGIFACLIPQDIVGDMTSIGTLFAFMLVSAGVWIMRVKNPELKRGFRTPLVPLVPILGILVCGAMIFGLGWANWMRLFIWMAIGFVVYFTYSIKHSKLRK